MVTWDNNCEVSCLRLVINGLTKTIQSVIKQKHNYETYFLFVFHAERAFVMTLYIHSMYICTNKYYNMPHTASDCIQDLQSVT